MGSFRNTLAKTFKSRGETLQTNDGKLSDVASNDGMNNYMQADDRKPKYPRFRK